MHQNMGQDLAHKRPYLLGSLLAAVSVLAGDVVLDLAAPGRPEADRTRDAADHPAAILAFAGVQPGMRIADVFGGGGYYSELVAQVVGPQGQVLLHNNAAYQSFIGEKLTQRLAGNRLPTVQRIDREADALGLEANSLDGALMVLVFHDFWFKDKDWHATAEQAMPQLRAALKPGAFLLVIDHAAQDGSGSAAAQELHRIDEKFAQTAISEFGFEWVKSSPLLRSADDDRTLSAFDPKVRGKTDRFVHLYRRPL